jgi:hypothetical protein
LPTENLKGVPTHVICGTLIDSIDQAIEAGCIPYFHDGTQLHEPACRECSKPLLQMDENGEMEVKEEYLGKIRFLYGTEPAEGWPGSGWVIGIAVKYEDGEPRH